MSCFVSPRWRLALTLLLPAGLLGCGGGSDEDRGRSTETTTERLFVGTAAENEPGPGKRGGHITVLSAGDVDSIDPGLTYYVYAYAVVVNPAHRTLYSFRPDNAEVPVPDLAEAPPEVSDDGRTV